MLQMRKRGPPHYHELLDQIGGKRFGLVDAARLFGERIARQGERPSARAPADLTKLTHAAFPLQVRAVAQGHKQGSVPVNLGERLAANVSRRLGEKAAGEDVAVVGHKDKPL